MDIKEMHENPPYGMVAILFIGGFVALLTNTLLNVAMPTIMIEFDIRPSDVQWVTTGYMLINGILIPASAFFIQRFTNRKVFLVAMSLFATGTLIAMVAPIFSILVFGRMVQASGAALMMPLLMNVMLTVFPVERRGTAMGVFGLVMIVAPAIGPTLSGWIIEHYTWRTLFGIILPFAVISLLLAFFKLKNITPNRKVGLDVFSLILSSIGFGGVLFGFSSAGDDGWTAPHVSSTIIIGTIALVGFIIRQFKLKDPMLDFKIYKYPMFALSSAIAVVVSISMFSGMIITPIYVQIVRGFSPVEAGLLMLPGAVLMGIMSPITGRLFDKFGARTMALIGLTITVVTTFMFSRLTFDTSYESLIILYMTRMAGLSLVMMPVMTNGLNQIPMVLNPHGTAINNTLQQVSGALGSALLLTVMTKRTDSTATSLLEEAAANGSVPTDPKALELFQANVVNEATLSGINFAFFVSSIIAIIAFVLALFIKRVTPPTSLDQEEQFNEVKEG
ncbi:MAG TPA: DHA2 family efflux MFS transporter permease subunit [Bacillota bacterium]|nr:DHA2 family efflux MFS transporter permease subunit [Bacillota bacterium]